MEPTTTAVSLQELQALEPTILAKVAEIEEKNLTITGIDDKEGYDAVHKARMELVRTRTSIQKVGKALRDDATKFAKSVIAREDELISLLSPLEEKLTAQQKTIDDEKKAIEEEKRIAAEKLLRDRVNALGDVGYAHDQFALKNMDDATFNSLLTERRAIWEKARAEQEAADLKQKELEKREAEIKAREAEVEAMLQRNRDIEAKVQEERARVAREEELQKAREVAAEQARKETEARIAREAKEKADAEAKALAAEEKMRNRNKKYQAFLDKNGCTHENKDEWFVETDDETEVTRLYKVVDTITL